MPRGIPRAKEATLTSPIPAPPTVPEPTTVLVLSLQPLILLQPQADGTVINAYGLEVAAVIDELRRSLIHLVAMQHGMTIDVIVPRRAAVVAKPTSTLATVGVNLHREPKVEGQ